MDWSKKYCQIDKGEWNGLDKIEKDVEVMIRDWKIEYRERKEWKQITTVAKT